MPDKQSYDLIDLFDICIERIAAGEAIDNILADYPDAADDLRALLQTGQLVYQAQITELELNISEVDSAKASTRQRLEDRLQKPKNNIVVMDKPKRRRRNTGWMSAAAGVAILIFGMMIGIIFTDQTSQNRTLDVTRTAIADLNVTTGVDGTAIAQVMTDESQLLATSSPIPAPMTGTLNPLQQTIVAQQSIQSTATPIPVTNPTDVINAAANITATADIDFMATQNAPAADVQQTQPAFATQRAGSVATMTPVPSQTAPPTRTPAPMGTFQPTLTPTDIDFGCPPGDCGNPPVSTSVASMNATPEAQLRFSGVQLTATSIAIQEMSLATQTSIASLLTTPVPGTQVAVLTVATQNFDSVQLDPLRAGEIDDNAEWDRYTEYRRNYLSQFANTVRDIDVRNRRIIQVVDDNGLPVQGATVRITALDRLISETRTYATGMTQFFPKLDAVSQGIDVFDVTVEYRNFRTFASLDLERPGDVVTIGMDFALNSASRAVQPLDILFLIDATSSMDDEIAQLQNNITVIAGQVDALPGNLDVRYGLVYYHDHSVPGQTVKQSGFTRDVNEFQTALNNLRTDSTNNNDWAEALNEGLYTTLTQMDWRDESVKLVFLVADARPHINHPDETHIYTEEALRAGNLGIKIHPIASSGLQPAGEYIFRQIAQMTMGHFVFLTYDNNQIAINSGAPGDTRTDLDVGDLEDSQGVGDYDVTQLDELVLRLITDELAALTTPVLSENRPTIQPEINASENLNLDPFALTSTYLVAQITQTAEWILPEDEYLEGITANDLDVASRSVFYVGLVAGGSIIGVLALVWFIIYRYRRRHRKRR